jgi:hypothetical protein
MVAQQESKKPATVVVPLHRSTGKRICTLEYGQLGKNKEKNTKKKTEVNLDGKIIPIARSTQCNRILHYSRIKERTIT